MTQSSNKDHIKILYVEDDALNQTILKIMLNTLGYQNVQTTADGQKTLELLADPNTELDLILMDLGLPDMDGITLTEKIRQSTFKSKDVPIIALTGNIAETSKQKSLNAGMNAFLTKPIEREFLGNTIEQILLKK